MAMAAIARRRRLLNDDVIVSLADGSWEILDISGSDVSDLGLGKVVEVCKSLQAVDIRYANLNFTQSIFIYFNYMDHQIYGMMDGFAGKWTVKGNVLKAFSVGYVGMGMLDSDNS